MCHEAYWRQPLFYTNGIPLLIWSNHGQFLTTSVDHGLIFFDFDEARWDWDEEKISKLEVSDDIVEYLVQNTLQGSLHPATVEILKFAACLGTREFNTFILSNILELPADEVSDRDFYVFDLMARSHGGCGRLSFWD
jgi:predicted ATPase